jgi:hypothetical protein
MLLREFFPGFMDDRHGTSYGSKNPKGSGRQWKAGGTYPYKAPPKPHTEVEDDPEDLEAGSVRLISRFRSKVSPSGSPRSDMGQTRVDVGNFLGQTGTFNALAERAMGFMPSSIVPLPGFNRMTAMHQDPNAPAQIPRLTTGPGVKHATGTPYGTRHASFAAGDDLLTFNPGAGDVLPDRDQRGLIKALRRFRELQRRNYEPTDADNPVIVGERA